MELHYIFITLAFVNFSPIMTTEYATSVYITNLLIDKAFATDVAGLETVIKYYVYGDRTMEEIVLLFAVPEYGYIFDIPDLFITLEQDDVQRKIYRFTTVTSLELDPYIDINDDALLDLGIERRLITGKVTKSILLAEIRTETPAIRKFGEICRLIALLRAIKFPDPLIKTADLISGICNITLRNGIVYKYKRFFGVIVMQTGIGPNGTEEYELLTKQIETWYPTVNQQS